MAKKVYRKETPEGNGDRARRGVRLYEERGLEIVTYVSGGYGVPSATTRDWVYGVDLEAETCECRDFEVRGGVCLHQFAATIFAAKRSPKALKPKRKASRFSGDWTADIPSDAELNRMGVA